MSGAASMAFQSIIIKVSRSEIRHSTLCLHVRIEKFPNVGSKKVAAQVMAALGSHGIAVEPVERGLDHGVSHISYWKMLLNLSSFRAYSLSVYHALNSSSPRSAR